jgi:hypothetical protein
MQEVLIIEKKTPLLCIRAVFELDIRLSSSIYYDKIDGLTDARLLHSVVT